MKKINTEEYEEKVLSCLQIAKEYENSSFKLAEKYYLKALHYEKLIDHGIYLNDILGVLYNKLAELSFDYSKENKTYKYSKKAVKCIQYKTGQDILEEPPEVIDTIATIYFLYAYSCEQKKKYEMAKEYYCKTKEILVEYEKKEVDGEPINMSSEIASVEKNIVEMQEIIDERKKQKKKILKMTLLVVCLIGLVCGSIFYEAYIVNGYDDIIAIGILFAVLLGYSLLLIWFFSELIYDVFVNNMNIKRIYIFTISFAILLFLFCIGVNMSTSRDSTIWILGEHLLKIEDVVYCFGIVVFPGLMTVYTFAANKLENKKVYILWALLIASVTIFEILFFNKSNIAVLLKQYVLNSITLFVALHTLVQKNKIKKFTPFIVAAFYCIVTIIATILTLTYEEIDMWEFKLMNKIHYLNYLFIVYKPYFLLLLGCLVLMIIIIKKMKTHIAYPVYNAAFCYFLFRMIFNYHAFNSVTDIVPLAILVYGCYKEVRYGKK